MQNLINLLFAEEVATVWGVDEVGELPEANLLCHASDHVLLLGHLDIESLLLHLHRVVLHNLLLRMEQSFQDLRLRLRQTLALLSLLES